MKGFIHACARAIRRSFVRGRGGPFQELGVEISSPVPAYRGRPWSGVEPSPFVQVLSPGRSGTRWLADVILSSTRHAVIHSQVGSLAEVGYLLDQGRVTADEALGAYLHARGQALEYCHASGCGLVDLDCKVSPFASMLMRRFPEMRCVVALRDPLAFVKSGLVRGYFRHLDPQSFGHLADTPNAWPGASGPFLDQGSRSRMIARFWNKVALLADAAREQSPSRVVLADMRSLFSSRASTASFLDSLGLAVDLGRLAAYREFDQVKNPNPARLSTACDPAAMAPEIYEIAYRGVSAGLLAGCGLAEPPLS